MTGKVREKHGREDEGDRKGERKADREGEREGKTSRGKERQAGRESEGENIRVRKIQTRKNVSIFAKYSFRGNENVL